MSQSKKTRFYRTLLVLFAVIVGSSGLAMAPSAHAQAVEEEDCAEFYTVQSGDSLYEIAQEYDTTYQRLAQINGLRNPRLIFPGQIFCVALADEAAVIPVTGALQQSDDPSISFVDVDPGDSVTVRGRNFPDDTLLNVLIGRAGTQGINGVQVGTVRSDNDGDFVKTFDIPNRFEDDRRLVVRVESPATGFFAFNTFVNVGGGGVDDDDRGAGRDRGARFEPDLPGDPFRVRTFDLDFGERATVSLGNAGVFLPESGYNATLVLGRYDASFAPSPRSPRLDFTQQLLFVDVQNPQVERVFGLTYVFFDIKQVSRTFYGIDNLDIYHYNTDTDRWEPCEVQVPVDGARINRLSCVISDFGFYGVAARR